MARYKFNPPPNWPAPPTPNWTPPPGWTPPADWPPLPEGWTLLVPVNQPIWTRWWMITGYVIAGIILISVLGSAAGGGGEPVAEATPAATATTTAEKSSGPATTKPSTTTKPAKPAEEKTARIGETVRDGAFAFKVTSVKCGVDRVGDTYVGRNAQGQFCLVTVSVKNVGDKPETFSDFDQRGFDNKGREIKADTEAGIYANDQADTFLNDINPGNRVKGVLVFDIPKRGKLAKVELHDGSFISAGVTVKLT